MRTPQGPVLALAFTLSRRSEAVLADCPTAEMLHILRHAHGRTAALWTTWPERAALRDKGVKDREIERLMALARRHGLV
jgi:cation transport protein ChaC